MSSEKKIKDLHDQFQKRNELYSVHAKLKKKLREKEPLPVSEAEKERTQVNKHALIYDDLVILNLDKEVYNDFVEMQKLRDQHKIGGLVSPRQRALSIALYVSLSSKPLFTVLATQKKLLAFHSLLLKNIAGFEIEEEEDEFIEEEKLETTTGKENYQAQKIDTTELEIKIIDLMGKPIKKKDFENIFSQKELLLIPLLLSRLNIEIISIRNDTFLLEYAKEKTDGEEWKYYTVLFRGTPLKVKK